MTAPFAQIARPVCPNASATGRTHRGGRPVATTIITPASSAAPNARTVRSETAPPVRRTVPSRSVAISWTLVTRSNRPADDEPGDRPVEQFVMADDRHLPVQLADRELPSDPEPDPQLLDGKHGVGDLLGEVADRVVGVEGDDVDRKPGLDVDDHGTVRAHGEPIGESELVEQWNRRVQRPAGRDDHMGARVAGPSDGGHDGLPRRLEEVLVCQQRPVDVERHELRPPGRRRHATGSSRSRPPRYGRSASGTWTAPSGRWWFSRMATIHRVVPSVPFRVATGRVPWAVRSRMPSRRDWKVVQFDVDVTSIQRCWEGSQASQSNLRAALAPRSPAATSITRYGNSTAASMSSSQARRRRGPSTAASSPQKENISTLWNWWTRMIPRVSRPCDP